MWRRYVVIVAGAFAIALGGGNPAQAQTVSLAVSTNLTQGPAPLAVFFDATRTSCSTCTFAFHEADYVWNFGDSGSGTWAHSGKSKNTAYGPMAAHVFEAPGTYSVRLTVTGPQGGTASRTIAVTVADPNVVWAGANTRCFSRSGIFDAGTQCDAAVNPGVVQTTTGSFAAAMSTCNAPDRRCLFRRGETFTAVDTVTLVSAAASPSTISAYGTGAKPVIQQTSALTSTSTIRPRSGWSITDVELKGPGTSGSVAFRAIGRELDVLFLRTDLTPNTYKQAVAFPGNQLDGSGSDLHEGIFIVENDWEDMGFGAGGLAMFIAARQLAILGNYFSDTTAGDHLIRIQHGEEVVISHNDLSLSHTKKHLLSIRSRDMNGTCSAGCGTPSHSFVISDNTFLGNSTWPFEMTSWGDGGVPKGEDFLIERNFVSGDPRYPNRIETGIQVANTDRVTLRNNIVSMDDNWKAQNAYQFSSGAHFFADHNTCYSPGAHYIANRCIRFRGGTATTGEAYNNLAYFPNASSIVFIEDSSNLSANAGNVLATANPFISSSPSSASDFRLSTAAQPVDAGSMAAGTKLDFLLSSRPVGSAPDAGAFEFGTTGSTPPPAPPPADSQPPFAPVLQP